MNKHEARYIDNLAREQNRRVVHDTSTPPRSRWGCLGGVASILAPWVTLAVIGAWFFRWWRV